MSASNSDLSEELGALSNRFADLGECLLTTARRLYAPGVLPPDDVLAAISECRRDFFLLRDRAAELARGLPVDCPSLSNLASLDDVSRLLDQVAEAEIGQSKHEEMRQRALSVLDRILCLRHSAATDFAPLRECHDQAWRLRAGIVASNWLRPHADLDSLADGGHPFTDLLSVVENGDELSDEAWVTMHENVSEAFGAEIAAAAVRNKLSLSTNLRAEASGRV
jgi:hypothetical protein